MRLLRQIARRHASWTALLFAAALMLRVVVPGGFMPVARDGVVTVGICNGLPGGPGTMAIAIPGLEHRSDQGDAAKQGCAFADLAQALMSGADPVLLLAALGFVLARGVASVRVPILQLPSRLRPPLRAPPVPA